MNRVDAPFLDQLTDAPEPADIDPAIPGYNLAENSATDQLFLKPAFL
jgi:hypothetical protein